MKKERQSNIETLRCLAMLLIIVFHLCLFILDPLHGSETSLYKALQIPFHIGVPVFVMISGYFGIHFSFRGLIRLISTAYVYFIPLAAIPALFAFHGLKDYLQSNMLLSFNHYWFLNTYVYLFLFSPVLNHYLKDITKKNRLYLLAILSFMCIYIGNVTMGDSNLKAGYDLSNFMLLYLIGNSLHHYQDKIDLIPQTKLVVAFFALNAFIVIGFMYVPLIAGKLWKYGFEYNSPIIMLNSALCLMIFSKMHYHSKFINWMGGSIFACYLIQDPRLVWNNVFAFMTEKIDTVLGGIPCLTIPAVIIYAIIVMIVVVCVDKMLSPIWNFIAKQSSKLDKKLDLQL